MVARIKIHKAISHIKAKKYNPRLKNQKVQKKLKKSYHIVLKNLQYFFEVPVM